MIQRDHGVYKPTTTETPMRERIARALKELSISRVSAGGEVSWEELADAVLDAMREPAKLNWVDNGRPNCGYNNATAKTPFGEILITWKGWKDYPNFCVDEPHWLTGKVGAYSATTLEDAKAWCEAEYASLIDAAKEGK